MIERTLVFLVALLTVTGCGSSCPRPDATNAFYDRWERELDQKKILPLLPRAKIDIKRDVHTAIIAGDAGALARSFHAIMKDPTRRFGLIRVERKRRNVGQDFQLHERFQGRYELDRALAKQAPKHCERILRIAEEPPLCEALWRFENARTSDYGIIDEFDLDPAPGADYRLAYRYLEGSPIAGSSTFVITPLGPARSRFTQIFLYQEQSEAFAQFFTTGGLRLHNQVVYSQIKQAADMINAPIIESDIPPEYR